MYACVRGVVSRGEWVSPRDLMALEMKADGARGWEGEEGRWSEQDRGKRIKGRSRATKELRCPPSRSGLGKRGAV